MTQIRSIEPGDYDAVLSLHSSLSPDNHYLRFFGVSPRAPELIAARLCVDVPSGMHALGAWWHDELIGVAHYECLPARPSEAGIAFAVADTAHRRGVATLLLEYLASHARTTGVQRFVADVLVRSSAMLRVFADAGLRVVEHREQDVLCVVAVVIVTSGVTPELGRTVRGLCHRYGMRLVGPNGLGLATHHSIWT